MSENAVNISVIIPTRDRCQRVTRLLESLRACRVPSGVSIECLVVDNGSKDLTRAAVEAISVLSPFPVTYLCEPVPGASRSRNMGIAAARGSILAFTDDDCVVEPEWLAGIAAAFERHPGLTGLFGRVLPNGESAIDASTLSVKTSMEPQDYRFPCSPFLGHGNNMAFTRQSVVDVGAFDIAFGPGAPLRAAEDAEMAYRLLRKGAWLRYEPTVAIRHMPRDTLKGMLHGHRRNAIGLGALFAKWVFRGDVYALKLGCWWWAGNFQGWRRAIVGKASLIRRIKSLYLIWVFYGALLRFAFNAGLVGRTYRNST